MKEPTPEMAGKPKDSGKVVLLSGQMSPPSNEHLAALRTLAKVKGDLWLAPEVCCDEMIEHVKAMCMIFCAEAKAAHGIEVTCCTAGLDQKLTGVHIREWCRRTFPGRRFSLALMLPDDPIPDVDILVKRKNQPDPVMQAARVLSLNNAPMGDVSARIARGSDESRSLFPNVWAYIQKHKLYR
jgi:hypothetical protein